MLSTEVSLASKTAARYLGGYSASKFAVAAYSQALRLELGPQGLHVLLVCLGPILGRSRYDQLSAGLPEQAKLPAPSAKLAKIDLAWLARKIVKSCERRRPEIVVPNRARWLFAAMQLSPRLGDWLLSRNT